MTANEARLELEEVPLGPDRLKHVGGVNANPVEDDGKFIHQRNVEVALGALDDLGGFGHFDAAGLVHPGSDDASVEGSDAFEGLGAVARHHLEDFGEGVFLVARIDAFRGVAHVKVLLPLETGLLFQNRNADFFRSAGIDRGFVDDGGALFHVLPGSGAGADQKAEVGDVGRVHRGRNGNDQKVGAGETARIGGGFESRGGAQVFARNFAGGVGELPIGVDLGLGKVEADGLELPAEFNSQRQPDVAEADDGEGGGGIIHGQDQAVSGLMCFSPEKRLKSLSAE